MSEDGNAASSATPPTSDTKKQYPVCSKCGSDAVVRDAWAFWNSETQLWELKDVFEYTYCLTCESEAKLVWNSPVESRKEKICHLNDELRQGQGKNGQILLTSGIHAHGQEFITEYRQNP